MLMLTFKALNNWKSDCLGTTKFLVRTAEEAFLARPDYHKRFFLEWEKRQSVLIQRYQMQHWNYIAPPLVM